MVQFSLLGENMRYFRRLPQHPSLRTRFIILVLLVVVLAYLSVHVTGEVFPSTYPYVLVFQSGLLVAVFGSLILEDKFTKPADAFVNGSLVIVSLLPLVPLSMDAPLLLLLCYTIVVLVASSTNLALLSSDRENAILIIARESTAAIATNLGKSRMIHSFLFLYAVHLVNIVDNSYSILLLLFWAIHLAMWPLKIPHLLDALTLKGSRLQIRGSIVRVEVPNIIRVRLERGTSWSGEMFSALADGTTRKVLPLYTQLEGENVIGTGLISEECVLSGVKATTGLVYDMPAAVSTTSTSHPIGLICEGSRIAAIRFETWRHELMSEGQLVYCSIGSSRVYYQVSDALTKQEAFLNNRHGFQVVEAHQVGEYDRRSGFKKYGWLPDANAPVFLADEEIQVGDLGLASQEMILGNIPRTDIDIVCDIDAVVSHHTAVLGVTGSGKTELAFRIIQSAIENKVKVFCVDITDQYLDRLKCYNPAALSINANLADNLSQKLHDAETGEYGAGKEKNILRNFTTCLRNDIDSRVAMFLEGPSSLGVFSLPSISNTKATLQATEIYLTSLFKYNRSKATERQRVLVVLEEAHTVVPEAGTMGLGDFDSKGMVAKIAQIALQGRKYDVGLLIIAQRTATVSKTVLTQCNTMISFSSFDKTGLEFLSNVYGAEHTAKISNLLPFQALAFGKGINSERPVVVQMPPIEESDSKPDGVQP